jgi:protein arginine N-methyltransferase 5
VLLPTPHFHSTSYAAFVNSALLSAGYLSFWLRIPLVSPYKQSGEDARRTSGGRNIDDPWEWWNNFRTACEFHANLGVALEITADLPSQSVLDRWIGEPIKAAIIPTSTFITNAKGYPVLSQAHQKFVKKLFYYNVQLLVKGPSGTSHPLGAYYQVGLVFLFLLLCFCGVL